MYERSYFLVYDIILQAGRIDDEQIEGNRHHSVAPQLLVGVLDTQQSRKRASLVSNKEEDKTPDNKCDDNNKVLPDKPGHQDTKYDTPTIHVIPSTPIRHGRRYRGGMPEVDNDDIINNKQCQNRYFDSGPK